MPPTSTTKNAPSQTSQPSRKGKKAWRKNVDITPVTTGLESLRSEIITHGRPLAEKSGDELFALDTVGATGSKDNTSRNGQAQGEKKIKVLKMDEILGRRSAVPALENEKKRLREERSAVGDGVVAAKRQKVDWVSKKEFARLRNNLDKASRLDIEDIENEVPSMDLWDTKQPMPLTDPSPEDVRRDEYIPQPREKVAPPTLQRPPVALTKTGQSTQAVPTPSAGHSYNPAYEDWDTLLTTAGAQELESEKKRLAHASRQAEKQARIDALAAQPDREPGLDDPESEWEGFETEAELDEVEMKRRKRPERKTPAQRNKLKRRKEAERLAKHESRMNERRKRGEEIVTAMINSQAPEDENLTMSTNPAPISSVATAEQVQLRRKPNLGPSAAQIPPQPLELILPDELQDSLRRLRPEGNLLTDRFRNLLVNGKLEARKKLSYAASRKRQVKMTEKWWSKDFQIGA